MMPHSWGTGPPFAAGLCYPANALDDFPAPSPSVAPALGSIALSPRAGCHCGATLRARGRLWVGVRSGHADEPSGREAMGGQMTKPAAAFDMAQGKRVGCRRALL